MKRFDSILLPCLVAVPICFIGALAGTLIMLVKQAPVYRAHAVIELLQSPPDAADTSQKTMIRALEAGALLSTVQQRLDRPAKELSEQVRRYRVIPVRHVPCRACAP